MLKYNYWKKGEVMQEFIESFGKNNLIIILAVICAIILALFIIILIEKIDRKRREKNEQEIEYYEEPTKDDEEIIYIDEEPTKEEAKQFLEEVQKKLKEEESDLIGPTHFEKEQEEKSIISYDELKKAANNIDETNDKLLEDEGEEPITIEELYKKQKEEQEEKEEKKQEQEETKEIEQPIQRQIKEEKKFRNSEVISPVFGIYKQEEIPFRKVSTTKPKSKDIEDIENEIKKTEQFLEELKKLKDKLD